MRNVAADDALSIILKLVGEACNLDCVYCYERRKPYSGNRILAPDLVRKILDDAGDRFLRVELHGGEPLLYPKSAMKELLGVLGGRPRTEIAIQTNGTLLDPEWLDLFEPIRPRLQFGLSIDGPATLNHWRVNHDGSSSTQSSERALELLRDRLIKTGVISVVTSTCKDQASELIDYCAAYENIKILKFVPCFDFNVRQASGPNRSRQTSSMYSTGSLPNPVWAISPAEYSRFLCAAFEHWMSSDLSKRIVLEPILAITQSLLGLKTSSCMFSDTKCQHVITVYPDGSVGSCDELDRADASYGRLSEHSNFSTSLADRFAQTRVGPAARQLEEDCHACSYYDICQGGCIASRLRLASVGRGAEYCSYRKSVIDFISAQYRGLDDAH